MDDRGRIFRGGVGGREILSGSLFTSFFLGPTSYSSEQLHVIHFMKYVVPKGSDTRRGDGAMLYLAHLFVSDGIGLFLRL